MAHLPLPEVDDVVLLAVHQVGVEDDIGIAAEKLPVECLLLSLELKILDAPDLHFATAVVHQLLGLTNTLLVHGPHVKLGGRNCRGGVKD